LLCACRPPVKTQANRNIERTRYDTIQEKTSGRREYVSAIDLLALS
jgi:hypothetical protein